MNRGISGANLPALRHHNAALVLDLLRAATRHGTGGISRLELAERTGLTPQAVSKITARLRAEGLAEESGRQASTGGKPRTELRLVRRARYAAGVHLDRDELTVVLADLSGERVRARTSRLDFGRPAGEVLEAVAREVRALDAGPAILGVGVAAPGPLDHASGVLHRVTGFPDWDGFPLRDALERRLGLRVVVDKDTNAAALAVLGQDAGDGSFAYLHLGTGLGAGLVLDGAVFRGERTGAGEFGHQVVQLDGPVCGCGNRGCIEAMCLAAVDRGDSAGAAYLLGVGAANLVSLLDIDRVVLGGRTVLADETLFRQEVAAVLTERTARSAGRTVPVSVAPGGTRVVADGAALLVLASVFGGAALG
ncbi:ROK family transcriptional regulator [Streptomyces sp. SID13666]|uniref:ROK family transcriptional regulator n=1 Tax=unclassified Streptomyces TaxID=2593676 RepID=UPI001105975D|nr:ROK family transcriptional regulator [Streptomyces sp. So13.3]NEA56372.1 ROK family transcriptional regulator [Streptomyces sp. SID13666]NEA73732.1 ROK family transcriptional regulator [Streptomyces sp. SID13588]QNA73586.1 ROK family transcriptional regulator [Streptomyces sp. So13.3]